MNGIFRFGLMCAAIFVALYPVSTMAAQFDAFLKLDGVKGESEAKGEGKGWIEIQGWDWGANNAATVCREAASGQATGRRQYSPAVFRKRIDKTTPLLHQALTTNDTIPSALLLIKQANGRYLKVKFNDVLVSATTISGAGVGGAGSESWTIKFSSCEVN